MAIEPIFSSAQLPANVISAQHFPRAGADVAPVQFLQAIQVQTMRRELDAAADRAPFTLNDVGRTPTYDVHARVEPVPGDGRGRGGLFDQRA